MESLYISTVGKRYRELRCDYGWQTAATKKKKTIREATEDMELNTEDRSDDKKK